MTDVRLLLIRHGQTPSNVAGSLDTALPGPELTALGKEQAAALPERLADAGIEAVFASGAVRAQATARPLAAALDVPVLELAGVHEILAGDLEKHTDVDSVRTYVRTLGQWAGGDLDLRMPGAESGAEFFARFDESVAEVGRTGAEVAAIVSHGGAIRCWTTLRAANLGPRFARRNPVDNTGVVVLDGDGDRWVARTWMGAPLSGPGIDDSGPVEDRVQLSLTV